MLCINMLYYVIVVSPQDANMQCKECDYLCEKLNEKEYSDKLDEMFVKYNITYSNEDVKLKQAMLIDCIVLKKIQKTT